MCQEGGRRSKKILQNYLNTMIGQDGSKMMIHKMKKRLQQNTPKKVPKTPEFVDTNSDDMDDEQEPTAKLLQKA